MWRTRTHTQKSFSHARLFAAPWIVAHQAPLSVRFSRQEYWSELPCPPSWDLPDPGIKPTFPPLQADSLPLSPLGSLKSSYRLTEKLMGKYRVPLYSPTPVSFSNILLSCSIMWSITDPLLFFLIDERTLKNYLFIWLSRLLWWLRW